MWEGLAIVGDGYEASPDIILVLLALIEAKYGTVENLLEQFGISLMTRSRLLGRYR